MYSTAQLTKIAELQIKINRTNVEIKAIKDMVAQLASDDCLVQINFSMLNQNKMDDKINAATASGHFFRMGREDVKAVLVPIEYLGIKGEGSIKSDCLSKQSFSFSESAAIRVLNAIVQEKYVEREIYAQELESLLELEKIFELKQSPTHFLNNGNHY
jgi:hypothetical protein